MIEPNKTHKYGYQDGNRGLEAKYILIGDTLHVKVYGSNHWTDYATNFLAWPRTSHPDYPGARFHPVWFRHAWAFSDFLKEEMKENDIERVRMIAHSMGGPVVCYMGLLMDDLPCSVITINAPKLGNFMAVCAVVNEIGVVSLYDKGDIVRRFPLFYSRYIVNEAYGNTKGIGKAHNNKPDEWGEFPI